MFGNVKKMQNVTKRPVFHQIFDSGPLLWTSAWYLHPCQTRWHCSSSWQFLVCFCTTTWIKCSAVNKTSQNEQFFINFTIQVLRSQHPHGICLLAEHVNTVHRVDHSWYIFILRAWTKCAAVEKKHHKTISFHQICDSGIMACSDYSTSAVVRVRASSPAWRYYYNVRFNAWRYHYNVRFNSVDFRWVHINFWIMLFRGSGRAARHDDT